MKYSENIIFMRLTNMRNQNMKIIKMNEMNKYCKIKLYNEYIFKKNGWAKGSPTKLGLSPTLVDLGWAECSLAQAQLIKRCAALCVFFATVQRT